MPCGSATKGTIAGCRYLPHGKGLAAGPGKGYKEFGRRGGDELAPRAHRVENWSYCAVAAAQRALDAERARRRRSGGGGGADVRRRRRARHARRATVVGVVGVAAHGRLGAGAT